MLDTYVRPSYQKICVDPIAKQCNKFITPNFLTLFACLSGVAILPTLILHKIGLACGLLLISGYLDTLDGSVARLQGGASKIGTVVDILSDRLVETTIIIGIFMVDPSHRGLLTLAMMASVLLCVTSFLLVGIFTPNYTSPKGFYYSPGLMERTEAFLFFGLIFCFPRFFTMLSILFTALLILTAVIRVFQFSIGEKI